MPKKIGAEVRIIAWSGPGAPAYPVIPSQKGLTGQAIQQREMVLSNDVQFERF